jgi:diguanylate cyclase (GGDEF)-like protein/PAS domain S-box-containing protein
MDIAAMLSWFARHSFFWQLLLAFIVVGLLPLLGIMTWQQVSSERVLLSEKSQQLRIIANEKQAFVLRRVQALKASVQQSAQTPVNKEFLLQLAIGQEAVHPKIDQYIADVSHSFLTLYNQDAWFLVSAAGSIVFTTDSNFYLDANLNDEAWQNTPLNQIFVQSQKQQIPIIQGYRWHDINAKVAALASAPVLDDNGETIGFVIVQINKNWLHAVGNDRLGLGKTGEINIGYRDEEGKGKPLTPPRYLLEEDRLKTFNTQQTPLSYALQGKEMMGEHIDYRGEPVLSVGFFEPELNVGMVVKQDISELTASLSASRTRFIQFALFVSVIMIGTVWWLSRRLSSPIERIATHIKTLGKGERCEPLSAELGASQELNELVTGINQTAMQLETHIRLLGSQAAQLETQTAILAYNNHNLEKRISEKTAQLSEYIAIVDEQVIISRTDLDGNITYASEAFCRVSGYSKAFLIGKNHRIVRHPDMSATLYDELWATITAGKMWREEILNMAKDGSSYWVDATISPTFDQHNRPTGYMAVSQNITNRKRAEALSIIDEMTNLYNRRYFNEQIEKLWRMAARHQQLLAFIMIDVDFFKRYNDSKGHLAGDDALKAVANVLQEAAKRSTEQAFRLGSEEMAVLLLVDQIEEAVQMAEHIRANVQALQIQHPANPNDTMLTISLGLCYFDGRGCSESITPNCNGLYQLVDNALYAAKEQGRNRLMVCDQPIVTGN